MKYGAHFLIMLACLWQQARSAEQPLFVSTDFDHRGEVYTESGKGRISLTELIKKANELAAKAWVITAEGADKGKVIVTDEPDQESKKADLESIMKRMAKLRRAVSYLARGRKPRRITGTPRQIAEELAQLALLSLAFKPQHGTDNLNEYYSLNAHLWLQAQELAKCIKDTGKVKEIYKRLRILEREGHKKFRKHD